MKSVRFPVALSHRCIGWQYVALPMLPIMFLSIWFLVSWIVGATGFADPSYIMLLSLGSKLVKLKDKAEAYGIIKRKKMDNNITKK